jgi:AraC-like DNA-binding protein
MEAHQLVPGNPGVPMHWVRKHCAGAIQAGLDFEAMLRDSCIDLDPDDPRGEVSRAQHLALILGVIVALDDEAHGMTRRRVNVGMNNLAMRVASTARTVEEAVQAFAKFFEKTANPVHLQPTFSSNSVEVRFWSDSVDASHAAAIEEIYSVSLMLNLNWLAGRKLSVQSFALRDPLHPNVGRLHWAFDAVTRHGPSTLLRVAPRQLLMRARVPAIGEFMWQPLRFWIENDPRINPGATSTSASWASAALRVADLTEASAFSERSLRRRFANEGHSFRELRRNAIADAGVKQLLSTDDTVEQIAAELGYSEARSFRRLLKAATGRTPAQIRTDRTLSVPKSADVLLYKRLRELVRRMEA